MLETITGLPDNVVGVSARGEVTRSDYEAVLIPLVENALSRHKKIRLLYKLGPDFSGIDTGAAWEDMKVSLEHIASWERMAVVTDVDWIRHMLNGFRFLLPAQVRVFSNSDEASARSWITAAAV